MTNTIYSNIKDSNIEELKQKGIILLDNEKPLMNNNLSKILLERNLLPIDIANLIGISRQAINSILNNNTKPSIEIALKLSYVLNIPVNEIFDLNTDYWFNNIINDNEKDKTYFFNTVTKEIMDSSEKKKFIKENKGEYYNKVDKKYISKQQRDFLLKKYIGDREDFDNKYTKVFIKLVKKFKPIVLGGD